MEYHLIFNPAAGRGSGQKLEGKLLKLVSAQFENVQVHKTNASGHATKIAESLKNSGVTIIVAGGDGTVHEVVNGMMGGNSILAVIPAGSGNDFIKMLNLPLDLNSAIQVIKNNEIMWVDIGRVNDRYFPNGMGIGFDAVVVMEALKRRFAKGFFIYLFSVFRAMRYYQNNEITLHLNGTIKNRNIFMINVGNGKVLGGGFRLTPDAVIDDGKLDVCIFSGLTKREILMHLPKGISGKHIHLPQVEMHKATNLLIESENGIPVHADGELISPSLKRIEIQVAPKSLQVIYNIQNSN
jgi:diacylglycerol kinase (ATP)